MMRAKRLLLLFAIQVMPVCFMQAKAPETKAKAAAASTKATAAANPVYITYINTYYKLAVQQQKRYKIPASITLAQGLLESGGGQSFLALAGNNHFGVKCTDWKGLHVYKYDAGVYSCFRKYLYVHSSFEDHSLFIAKRSYYRSLFKLKQTDYKSWATGLNKCGYASDSAYGAKLISLIEQYHLDYYDTANESTPPHPMHRIVAVAKTSPVKSVPEKTTRQASTPPSTPAKTTPAQSATATKTATKTPPAKATPAKKPATTKK